MNSSYKVESSTNCSDTFKGIYLKGNKNTFKIDDIKEKINELKNFIQSNTDKNDSLDDIRNQIQTIENEIHEITQHLYPLEGLMYTTYEYVVGRGEPDEHESNVFINENVASCLTQMFRQDGLLDTLWNSMIQNTKNINELTNRINELTNRLNELENLPPAAIEPE